MFFVGLTLLFAIGLAAKVFIRDRRRILELEVRLRSDSLRDELMLKGLEDKQVIEIVEQ
jgi:hypothetical protein